MTNTPKFTIILAAHQTAPYLPKALSSIANQTFRDFEVICYVEESTDESLEICNAFAAKDTRFWVVSAPKSGAVATTRNYGIAHAKGEYLVALDGDDWIREDMLAKVAAKIDKTGEVDIVSYAGIVTESDDVDWNGPRRFTNFRASDEEGVFTGLDAIRRAGRNGGSMNNHTVLSTCRTKFLRDNRIFQSDGLLMEDFGWTPRVWYAAKRFAYLDETLYAYRRRPGSLTTEASPRVAVDIAKQFRTLSAFASGHDVPEDIMRVWASQWLSIIYWFLFHPVTSRKITDENRARALDVLMEGDGLARFKGLARRTSKPKRLAAFFVLLAWHGWQAGAKCFFRKLYYPLIERRSKRCKDK